MNTPEDPTLAATVAELARMFTALLEPLVLPWVAESQRPQARVNIDKIADVSARRNAGPLARTLAECAAGVIEDLALSPERPL